MLSRWLRCWTRVLWRKIVIVRGAFFSAVAASLWVGGFVYRFVTLVEIEVGLQFRKVFRCLSYSVCKFDNLFSSQLQ